MSILLAVKIGKIRKKKVYLKKKKKAKDIKDVKIRGTTRFTENLKVQAF